MLKKYRLFILLLIFGLYSYSMLANLTVTVQPVDWGKYVSAKNFPILEANISVKKDGIITPIGIENIIIYEDNLDGIVPIEVAPIKNGWQKISWYPANVKIGDVSYNSELVITLAGESAVPSTPFTGSFLEASLLKITDQDAGELRECSWGTVEPNIGNKIPIQIHIYPKHIDQENTTPIRIDSITTNTDVFYVSKKGALWYQNTFPDTPCELKPEEGYYINVTFEPNSWDAIHDILTIHFEGGLKTRIPLFGNEQTYPKETVLHLIQPNGNEILTPCDEFEIKWENYAKNTPVNISFSNDGGHNWRQIASVKEDSVYKWTIQSEITKYAAIRVSQELAETATHTMTVLQGGISKLAYSADGSKALGVGFTGGINNFNLYPNSGGAPVIIDKWMLGDTTLIFDKTFGVDYLSEDTVIAAYNTPPLWGNPAETYLAYFQKGDTLPYQYIKIDKVYGAKKMILDPTKQFMAFISNNYNPTLSILNPKDATVKKTLTFTSPVIDFVLNSKLPQALVATLDGMLYELSLPNFNIINTIDNRDENIPILIGYSPNGKLLSLGYPNNGGLTDNFLFDIERQTIVKPIRSSGSNPVVHTFSPDSRLFVLGSKFNDQITLLDLSITARAKALSGHTQGRLTDVQFAPDAHSMISSSSDGTNNFKFRTFSFPDYDASDKNFEIKPVDVALPVQHLETVYMGTEHQIKIDNVCNIGDVPINYTNLRLAKGIHFKLPDNQITDATLLPTECGHFELTYFPYAYGTITDTLMFTVCKVDYYIEITGEALPRNISFFTDEYNFGEVCLNEEERYQGVLLTNNDPVPLIVNRTKYTGEDYGSFWREDIDTVLAPHQSLEMWISFEPAFLGKKTATWQVLHSNQENIIATLPVKGVGIGTYVNVSHETLLFIPEIDTRELTVVNIGETPIVFDNVEMNPEGYFDVITNLPQTVAAHDSIILEVRRRKTPESKVEMSIQATPCLVQSSIILNNYVGSAKLTIADIESPPTKETMLPIHFKTTESAGAYQGKRFFEAELTVNPHLFIPIAIESPLGNAQILDNYEFNGKRHFTIRVEGDFKGEGTLANITAIPGIAETDYSTIDITEDSQAFGKAVSFTAESGSIKITDTKGRKIYRPTTNILIQKLLPNPADEYIEITFDSKTTDACTIDIVATDGTVVSSTPVNDIVIGTNTRKIIIKNLASGTYTICLYSETGLATTSLLIVR